MMIILGCHFFADTQIAEEIPFIHVGNLLGHQNLNTTQIYARVYDETLYKQFQEAISSLENRILKTALPNEAQDPIIIVSGKVGDTA